MSASQGSSPMSNLTYDLIAALHNKLEAVTAYDKYLQDAQGDEQCKKIFQQMQQEDRKHADMLKAELTRHLSGK
ncbi:MAG: hypothetical protein AVDCRST_MAG18-3671 [uncultured Thermomicrobiales bacterium]|uniref:Ferritin-like diiron domain-containing protein n=1 Tax=uncultured Thermomicrobiales bacterium TaxID=1645740 RepID=A0A6J4VTW2_9BACT|nr:MAG: hypothetical protein AVDCRST_MAG18-3671 [uncultured Thermomicrobiales bacterium]